MNVLLIVYIGVQYISNVYREISIDIPDTLIPFQWLRNPVLSMPHLSTAKTTSLYITANLLHYTTPLYVFYITMK